MREELAKALHRAEATIQQAVDRAREGDFVDCYDIAERVSGDFQPYLDQQVAEAVKKERERIAEWIYKPENEFIRRNSNTGDYMVFMPIHYLNRMDSGIFPSDEAYEQSLKGELK